MAFHVACPITCRKICYCTLGFPRALRSENGKEAYIDEVVRVEQLLKDPWRLRAKDGETVQVKVPKVVVVVAPPPPPPRPVYVPVPAPVFVPQLQQQQQTQLITVGDGGGDVDEVALANASAQTKRFALQKKAAAASVVAEDFARRFEAGDLEVTAKDIAGEDQGLSNVKIMCRLCFSGEDEASERARKMLPCKSCGKKYHRNCVKAWSQNRDLFHWSSWTCPSCRICEVCRRTGDPNKFMFCRRCDAAYHCYCQHPPHKNVSSGPYLCPKHTKCHSCGSNVPGNGLSLRWFLGYTCCDACGRLFMKGNYCPICLKVYRDSESTPMVCCDICQRWVHCQCDDISDEKYHQFQVDGNLQYVCATCRGECCQVRNIEEAVQELWRRKDEADVDLILSLRAAAGLPTQEDIFSITPFSDDEDNDPVTVNNEYGRSLKLSLKGPVVDKSPKKTNNKSSSSNKKSGKKKPSTHNNFDAISSPDGGIRSSKRVQIKTNKWMDGGDSSAVTAKGPSKLVIHIGARNKNSTDPILTSSNGGKDKDVSQMVDQHQHVTPTIPSADTKGGDKVEGSKMKGKEGHLIKFKKHNSEASKLGGTFGSISPPTTTTSSVKPEVEAPPPPPPRRGNRVSSSSVKYRSGSDDETQTPVKESRPLLKLKFKKPYQESQSQSSWLTNKEEEKSLAKGQRSKRKRHVSSSSTTLMEDNNNNTNSYQDNAMDEMMDASWILQKLGKDAIGKRVEMHQPSDNTWHRGTVAQVFEGTSMISVGLDDGNSRNLELGKQGIRFVSQKQKRV